MDTPRSLFADFARLIADIHNLEDLLMQEISAPGLTDLQHRLLQVVYFDGRRTPGEISHCLGSNLPNTSREVKKLAEKGLLEKSPSPQDRRSVLVDLTPEGRRTIENLLERMMDQYFRWNGMPDSDSIRKTRKAIRILQKRVLQPALEAAQSS